MFHCSHDLMECPSSLWPLNAKAMVNRYLPLMKLQFGEEDSDVKNIERKLLGTAGTSEEVMQSFQALTVSEDPGANVKKQQPAAPKTSKKKGNNRKNKGGST